MASDGAEVERTDDAHHINAMDASRSRLELNPTPISIWSSILDKLNLLG